MLVTKTFNFIDEITFVQFCPAEAGKAILCTTEWCVYGYFQYKPVHVFLVRSTKLIFFCTPYNNYQYYHLILSRLLKSCTDICDFTKAFS